MRIGEVARASGVGVQTLRFYERRGLVKTTRLVSGYRNYTPDAVLVVRFIKQSQELGYTLGEIKQLLSLRARPSGNSAEVRALAQAKLRDIENKIERLHQMRDGLSHILNACACGGDISRCPTLDALDHAAP
ncbi:MAG TPA: heavy metal-responsive transcriptional regulator [Pyrinomonadaceae bacterium]|jgi:DNA-binding transcriptional MerR regulator|nr:heavy metal-responsive transcriptional regulator [Pyrinomonadaceae bacterium]